MNVTTYSPLTPAIVTGGASGIGRASAAALAGIGRPVALWDIDEDGVQSAARELTDSAGVNCIGVAIDVADTTATELVVDGGNIPSQR